MDVLNDINAIIGPIGFIITVFSFIKIKNVEEKLRAQKELILFKKSYKAHCKDIKNLVDIISKDGIKKIDVIAISSLLDKIKRSSGGLEKSELKELNEHLNKVEDLFSADDNYDLVVIVNELSKIRNIIEKAGELNGI